VTGININKLPPEVPFNCIANPEFRRVLTITAGDPKIVGLSRSTYDSLLDAEFDVFTSRIGSLLKREFVMARGLPYPTLVHDIWTEAARNNVVWSSVVFIDSTWCLRYIALGAARHNLGHGATQIAAVIKSHTRERYDADLDNMAKFVMSDTTGTVLEDVKIASYEQFWHVASAKNVANSFDQADQKNCLMHVLGLCLCYAVGLKENTLRGQVVTPGLYIVFGCYIGWCLYYLY